MILALLFVATLFLAWANGANDNAKGVATLIGSGAASYRQAMLLATLATAAGCVASVFLAADLVRAFSGKGLVPDAVAGSPQFLLAVAAGAAGTVLLATVLSFPISTTHALTGALVGAGATAAAGELRLGVLGSAFVLPLLVSPLLAAAATIAGSRALAWHSARRNGNTAVPEPQCLCVGEMPVAAGLPQLALVAAPAAGTRTVLVTTLATQRECAARYPGRVWGVPLPRALGAAHVASAGLLSFARGLNDTPKIVALLLVVQALDIRFGMLAIAAAMALGGLLGARKVARTMSHRIAAMGSTMGEGQAFAANLVTAALVIGASRFGLPVSTTHVSVGAIGGLGLANRSLDTAVLRNVVLSWVVTLPLAACIAAASWWAAQAL